ncbi:hypothetical protein CICLE_v10001717mg [Citrus x clementina]|uniref:glucan endo-1,3-beta-D-glucosidase n=1 Tax=Citrus clementina TaxID=85681 RepID=V4T7A6_CITCL|nr:probable glucan endo-1,3-beta-glucosidase BG4 [Citrus x clementina]XP_015384103.2 glucan endo-1,3-beta-glucosidase [Citrus sinensis]ESR47345.1 hypothetical protein CICLE_v10001717mg [Citrus x clementina]
MESIWARGMLVAAAILVIRIQLLAFTGANVIGVNYGLNGDNLPPPEQVIDLYGRCQINFVRLFEPRHEVLEALRGRPQLVSLGTKNEEIQSIASSQQASDEWVKTHVVPFVDNVNIGYITVGNEVIPGTNAQYVGQAINNILNSLNNYGITKQIKVTTVLAGTSLASSYPPSAGAFTNEAAAVLKDIAQNLWHRGFPIMINVYPYFAYASDPSHISLDYALFQSKDPVVRDGPYLYYNLFDAMVDAYYSALEKIDVPNVTLAISESGWPSAGNEPYTSIENAQKYNKNLMDHVLGAKGTPRRPGQTFDTFLFEMFNENQKPAGVEQNFGFFYPNMQPIYPFWPC